MESFNFDNYLNENENIKCLIIGKRECGKTLLSNHIANLKNDCIKYESFVSNDLNYIDELTTTNKNYVITQQFLRNDISFDKFNLIILFCDNFIENRKKYYKYFCSENFESFDDFDNIFNTCTQNYSTMVIYNKKVFKYHLSI